MLNPKRRSLRLFAVLLALVLTIPMALSAFADGAEAPEVTPETPETPEATPETPEETRNIDDYLKIHWDFEGETAEEAMKDKATADEVATNLEFVTGSEGVEFQKGIATTTAWTGGMIANPTADTMDIFESDVPGTWFYRFFIPSTISITKDCATVVEFRCTKAADTRPFFYELGKNGNAVRCFIDSNANNAFTSATVGDDVNWIADV